jgi:hypothetical protein
MSDIDAEIATLEALSSSDLRALAQVHEDGGAASLTRTRLCTMQARL